MVRGVSHTVGVVLSTNYSQFISDAAHAAVIASMLAFFYFESGFFFFLRRAAILTMQERGLVPPRPLVT